MAKRGAGGKAGFPMRIRWKRGRDNSLWFWDPIGRDWIYMGQL